MPIAVRVVKEQTFNDWAAALKARDKKKAKEIIRNAAARARRHDQDRRRRAADSCDSRGRAAPAVGCDASGASADTKASDMATKAHADHGHGDDHAHTPTASGAGSTPPTTKTSARCTCCSPSWAGLIGGFLSVAMRMELQEPGLQYFANGHMFNVFVTGHGLIMVFFMVMPAHDRRLRQLVRAAA